LQCPTASFNTDCVSYTHYNNWGTTDTAGPPIQYKWDYGTTQQLQGLTFGDNVTYRDGNADGILDYYKFWGHNTRLKRI
jgi:hypothetical protein